MIAVGPTRLDAMWGKKDKAKISAPTPYTERELQLFAWWMDRHARGEQERCQICKGSCVMKPILASNYASLTGDQECIVLHAGDNASHNT